MRCSVIVALLGLLAGPVTAQELRTCSILDGQNPRSAPDARVTARALIEEGTVTMAVFTTSGSSSASDLVPVAPGLSSRTVLREIPGGWAAVFNLARVEPDGVVRLDTWIRETTQPTAEPVHIWTRMRC